MAASRADREREIQAQSVDEATKQAQSQAVAGAFAEETVVGRASRTPRGSADDDGAVLTVDELGQALRCGRPAMVGAYVYADRPLTDKMTRTDARRLLDRFLAHEVTH